MPRPVTSADLLCRERDGKIYVTPAEESQVRALIRFVPWRYGLDAGPVRRIGMLGAAEVVVREWAPSPDDEDIWSQETSDLTFEEWVAEQKGSAHA